MERPRISKTSFWIVFAILVSAYGLFAMFTSPLIIVHGQLQQVQQEQIEQLFKPIPDITIEPNNSRFIEANRTEVTLQRVPGVAVVSSILEDSGVMIQFKGRNAGAHIEGVSPSRFRIVTPFIAQKSSDGQFLEDDDADKIVLGAQLAGPTKASKRNSGFWIGARIGDSVRVVFSNNESREYQVKGVVETGGYAADFTAYLVRSELESVLPNSSGMATEIQVKITDPSKMQEVKNQIQQALAQERIDANIKTLGDVRAFTETVGGSGRLFSTLVEQLKTLHLAMASLSAGILAVLYWLSRSPKIRPR